MATKDKPIVSACFMKPFSCNEVNLNIANWCITKPIVWHESDFIFTAEWK